MDLQTLKTLLLDGDGVLWRGNDPIPGLNRFFDVLAGRGIEWVVLTNNNTRTLDDFVQKLRDFGIQADESRVLSSSIATAVYLEERFGRGAPIHVVGMSGLIDPLRAAGFRLTVVDEQPAYPVVAVVAGQDREITHEKIKVAMRLILGGALFVATNTDPSFPTPEGLNPGTGMVIGALKGTTEVEPLVIGKPGRALFDAALKRFGGDPATSAMLGDRLDTDILGARNAGIGSIAVLTGVTTREQLAVADIQPDLVFESIAELADALERVAAST